MLCHKNERFRVLAELDAAQKVHDLTFSARVSDKRASISLSAWWLRLFGINRYFWCVTLLFKHFLIPGAVKLQQTAWVKGLLVDRPQLATYNHPLRHLPVLCNSSDEFVIKIDGVQEFLSRVRTMRQNIRCAPCEHKGTEKCHLKYLRN